MTNQTVAIHDAVCLNPSHGRSMCSLHVLIVLHGFSSGILKTAPEEGKLAPHDQLYFFHILYVSLRMDGGCFTLCVGPAMNWLLTHFQQMDSSRAQYAFTGPKHMIHSEICSPPLLRQPLCSLSASGSKSSAVLLLKVTDE